MDNESEPKPVTLTLDGRSVRVAPNQTVLEALELAGFEIPNSCRSGHCLTCLVRAVSGSPGSASQVDFKATWKRLGWFLSCSCRPTESLVLARLEDVAPWTDVSVELTEHGNVVSTSPTDSALVGQWAWLEIGKHPLVAWKCRSGDAGQWFVPELTQGQDDASPPRDASPARAGRLSLGQGESFRIDGSRPHVLVAPGELAPVAIAVARELQSTARTPNLTLITTPIPEHLTGIVQAEINSGRLSYHPTVDLADGLARHGHELDRATLLLWGNRGELRRLKTTAFREGAALADIHGTELP